MNPGSFPGSPIVYRVRQNLSNPGHTGISSTCDYIINAPPRVRYRRYKYPPDPNNRILYDHKILCCYADPYNEGNTRKTRHNRAWYSSRDPCFSIRGYSLTALHHRVRVYTCLLYTSDAADERSSVDLGGR